jgi:hypothetical protein
MPNNKGIVIFQKTLSIKIMLPEQSDLDDIKKKMEEELHVNTGDSFIPIMYTKEARGNIDFGSYGRRWCIEVVIDASKEEDFLNLLRSFCKKYGIALNERGAHPFEGRHYIFEK